MNPVSFLHFNTPCAERMCILGGASGPYWPRISLQMDDTGPYHTKAAMCRTASFKYVMRLYETDELYDLESDPGETSNLIDDPVLESTLNALRYRLLKWYMETADVVPFKADNR